MSMPPWWGLRLRELRRRAGISGAAQAGDAPQTCSSRVNFASDDATGATNEVGSGDASWARMSGRRAVLLPPSRLARRTAAAGLELNRPPRSLRAPVGSVDGLDRRGHYPAGPHAAVLT